MPTRQLAADITIVGTIVSNGLCVFGDPDYRADADVDSDGDIDASDATLLAMELGLTTIAHTSFTLIPCEISFAGGVYDELTGLHLFRNRWYDSTSGRWISRDPAGYIDGLNLYLYVQANPLSYWDPFGLYSFGEWWSDLKAGAGFVGEVGEGVGTNVCEIAEDTGQLLYEGGLGIGNTLGVVSDETFYENSQMLVPLAVTVDEQGLGATARQIGESAVDAVKETGRGLVEMDPDAYADVLTAAGEVAVGTKGLSKVANLGKVGKIGNGPSAKPPLQTPNAPQTGRGMQNPKVAAAAAVGRQKDKEFSERVAQKPGWRTGKDAALKTPEGGTVYPDALDPKGRPVELKPNSVSGRKKGVRQINMYKSITGTNGRVVYYDP